MKILVTGGAGFIGSHVVDAYIWEGHDVVVLDNLTSGKRENVNRKARLVTLDIRSSDARKFVINEKFEVINHHAAHIHVGRSIENPANDADINIMGTLNILEGARFSGSVKQFIFASSGGAIYGNKQTPFDESMDPRPLSPYGVSKRAAELYLQIYQSLYGIMSTSLRYANVYGPRQNASGEAGVISIFLNNIKHNVMNVINGSGNQTRDFVYVKDVANANLLALKKKISGEFNIGTNREISINELVHVIYDCVLRKPLIKYGPPIAGEQLTSRLDYSKAKRELGWEPKTILVDGLRETAEFFEILKSTYNSHV